MSAHARVQRGWLFGLVAAALVLLGGQMAAAQRAAADPRQVEIDPQRASQRLAELSAAFREVAKVARPSVVQVTAEARGARRGMRGLQMPGDEEIDPEEFFRRFFGEEFRGSPFSPQDPRRRPEQGEGRQPRRPRNFEQYDLPQQIGAASGWIYDSEGHIITNRHVVENADEITVRFLDESKAAAKLVGSDRHTDIAVLKIDKQGLTPAKLADVAVEPGDIVLAIGSPFEYAFSISQGIVSATGRRVGILGPGGYEDFIQTDAAINPGNSGGPLINIRGEVVGMNTAIATRTGGFAGIGFAIPARMIRDVAEQLIRTGSVRRGYLGAMISDDPQMLKSFGADAGVLIEDAIGGGPAEKAGLAAGDVILQVEGADVESAPELRQRIAAIQPGKTVRLQILRDGKRTTIPVKLGELPEEIPTARTPKSAEPEEGAEAGEALERLGLMRLRTLTEDYAQQQEIDFHEGVLVLEVRETSVAAAEGIEEGDLITQVMGKPVKTFEDLNATVQKANLKEGVRLRIRKPQGISRFVLLQLQE